MSRQKPLKMTYNNQLNTDVKDYLPIIGNVIPHKQTIMFDSAQTGLIFTQMSGTATGAQDYIKSYHSDSCYKVILNANSSALLSLDFSSNPIDLTSLGTSTNNYATVNQCGQYGNEKDKLYLVLNLMYHTVGAGISIVIFNDTKYASMQSSYTPVIEGILYPDRWIKMRWAMNSQQFLYQNGFTNADWKNITKIEFVFSTDANIAVFYLQDLYTALPAYDDNRCSVDIDNISDSYYPHINESNSIFVSQLFGDDRNGGITKQIGSANGPVETIEQAISLTTDARFNIVLLDSATYKPVALDGTSAGIRNTLSTTITILADYLETPIISAEPGLFDENRVGARVGLRTAFYENQGGSGNILTVGSGAAYPTISAAVAAASSGDCIEIIDSATYDEANIIIASMPLTIQSAPGCLPTWTCSSQNTTFDDNAQIVYLQGIAFQGNGVSGERRVILGQYSTIHDCTFSNVGTSTGTATAVYYETLELVPKIMLNCLFVDNGENFIALEFPSGLGGVLYIKNTIGYLGNTTNCYFIKDGKADNTFGLNIVGIGNKVLGKSNATLSYFYNFYDTSVATKNTSFFGLLNEFNTQIMIYGDGNGSNQKTVTYLCNNYIHDNNALTYSFGFFTVLCPTSDLTFQVSNCFFYKITPNSDQYIVSTDNVGTQIIENNIFSSCTGYCIQNTGNSNVSANLFYNCGIAICFYAGGTITSESNIFINCTYSIYTTQSPCTVNAYNSFFENSSTSQGPNTTINIDTTTCYIYGTTGIVGSNLIDPANNNFSWYYDSAIEILPASYGAFVLENIFISPAAVGHPLYFELIDFEGFYNITFLSSRTSMVSATYCNINNSLVGVYNTAGQIDILNCFMTGNGIAVRENNSNIISNSLLINNIIDTNGTGVMFLSACDCEYNTIINNNYGLVNIFSGFYAQANYISKYLVIKNNIIAQNAAWDYIGKIQTDYCVIPRRYYDSLAITNADYTITVGVHDIIGQPEIDIDTYFPNTIYEGYSTNSPTWQAASDTWTNLQSVVVNRNIGARNIPYLTSSLNYDQYDFNYTGTISAKEEFYALENPNVVEYHLQPINNESARTIDGQYFNNPTAYTNEMILNWTAPGDNAKILDVGRLAFEGAFKSNWVIGISKDSGITFTYYRVQKDNDISMSTKNFSFNDTITSPYGNFTLHLIQMPDSWIITNFLINCLGE